MARLTETRRPAAAAPRRSPGAAQAHAAGRVTSTIDLTSRPAAVVRQASTATRNASVLGAVAGVIWLYDLARVVS